jgi:hypothetical protein
MGNLFCKPDTQTFSRNTKPFFGQDLDDLAMDLFKIRKRLFREVPAGAAAGNAVMILP